MNRIVCIAVVVLCYTSAIMCQVSDNVESDVQESRTFGHHFLKRISFAIIPAAFVVGMIFTLLGALTVVSVKSLGTGVILLILTIGQMIARGLPQAVPLAYSAGPAPPVPIVYKDCTNCALRKSWKLAPNFDDEIPKFTPFDNMDEEVKEVKVARDIKTTEAVTQPSPSAETLKISSKFKMPGKIAKIFKEEPKEGFGKFAYEIPEDSNEEKSEDDDSSDNNEGVLKSLEIKNSKSEENDDDDGYEITSYGASENATHYNIGRFVNVTVDEKDSTVNVNLDQNTLKEVFSGRGKRFGMLERLIPLFILPFLLQSAIIPFMLTTIKLFLMKSLFAGKVAILFLLLGALRSHHQSLYMKSFAQSGPFLHRDYPFPNFPERRHETQFDGYKVEGKPDAFIN